MATPLTVADYEARMLQAVGNPAALSTGIVLIDVLNEALQYVFTYDNWTWRARSPVLLDLVVNQSYVSLPADFGTGGELDSIASIWSPLTFVHMCGLAEIAKYRGLPTQNYLQFYLAISN